jgi:plastocyanin
MRFFRRSLTALLTLIAAGVLLIVAARAKHRIAPAAPAVSCRVTARVELLNSKIKNRGKADAGGVVIWLDPLDGPAPRLQRPRQRMDQRGKRFIPHVVAVQRGSEVDFPNSDPFFHNVFSLYNGKRFDLGLYASGESRPVLFNRPGVSHIFCNIHPQMSAVVVALDTPYFGVSDRAGNVAVADVPEGRYTLRVWHERTKPAELDALTRQVRITPAAADLGVIRLSEEGYVPQPHPNKHGQDYDNERNRPPYRRP